MVAQYLSWLGHVLTVDLGRSYLIGGQIADLVKAGLTNTVVLTGAALLLAVVGSVVTRAALGGCAVAGAGRRC